MKFKKLAEFIETSGGFLCNFCDNIHTIYTYDLRFSCVHDFHIYETRSTMRHTLMWENKCKVYITNKLSEMIEKYDDFDFLNKGVQI